MVGGGSFKRARVVRSHANERFGAKLRCGSRERINSGSESYLAESFWESLQPKRKRTFVRAWAIIPSMCSFIPRGVGTICILEQFCWGVTIIYSFARAQTAALPPVLLAYNCLISTPLANSLQLSPMQINISCDARTPESNPFGSNLWPRSPFLIRSLSRPAGKSPAPQRRTKRCWKRGQPASIECEAEIWRRPFNI